MTKGLDMNANVIDTDLREEKMPTTSAVIVHALDHDLLDILIDEDLDRDLLGIRTDDDHGRGLEGVRDVRF